MSQALPIHSLHTPDLAALQGSQGIATSLSVLQNNLQSHGWQHTDGASQQSGAGLNGVVSLLGQSQQGSQQPAPALDQTQAANGAAPHADHGISRPFDRSFGLSQQQQQSQQGSQSWDAGSQQVPSGSGSQQQVRPPKRKLPFSVGLQPDLKRQSPGPDQADRPAQRSQSSDPPSSSAAAGIPAAEPDIQRSALSAFVSPQQSPLGHSKPQAMSPSLLLVSHQDSPADMKLAGQPGSHAVTTAPSPSPWSSDISAMLH